MLAKVALRYLALPVAPTARVALSTATRTVSPLTGNCGAEIGGVDLAVSAGCNAPLTPGPTVVWDRRTSAVHATPTGDGRTTLPWRAAMLASIWGSPGPPTHGAPASHDVQGLGVSGVGWGVCILQLCLYRLPHVPSLAHTHNFGVPVSSRLLPLWGAMVAQRRFLMPSIFVTWPAGGRSPCAAVVSSDFVLRRH